MRHTEADDSELRRFYDQQTRMIKLQQVNFATAEEARAAQQLLLKGLSFEQLMKRYPNADQTFDQFILPQQLPAPLAAAVEPLNRGDVTREPVRINNRYYLFKLSKVERNPKARPFELVRNQIARQVKQQKVNRQINRILQENGIKP
nr:peptidylprolyl isomerase [Bergeriella denitrificans]